ncbi:MAG: transglycosylase domain-containing protein [Actinomycetota bacterium]|nr:transglycosylase domain-containing protein [Actinomycetota bacterium]
MAPRSRSRGRRRRARRAAAVLAAVAIGSGLLFLASLPAPSAAATRVDRLLSKHGTRPLHVPPPHRLAASVVAIEDHAFYGPPGTDIAYGAARWIWGHVTSSGPQGGSTLAQQLAKLLFFPSNGPLAKLDQAGMAFRLELHYSHAQLMNLYLDAAYFGDGSYGARQASLRYFGQEPRRLSWPQAALLAGTVQAPGAYDPLRHPGAAMERRGEVLAQLAETGAISPSAAGKYERDPLQLISPTAPRLHLNTQRHPS